MGLKDLNIVLVAGPPAGGKTTIVKEYVDAGFTRLNRDTIGGGLHSKDSPIYQKLQELHGQGVRKFVLDNLYTDTKARAVPIALAQALGLTIGLLWLETSKEQAQLFAARRQIQKYGKLFAKADYKAHKNDPGMFPPGAQFAYWKRREEPTVGEGFAAIVFRPMKTVWGPEYDGQAVIFDFDGTLRATATGDFYPKDPDDVVLLPGRRGMLQVMQEEEGWLLLGASNQSGIARDPSHEHYVSETVAIACFNRTCELLGVDIDYLYAPDRAGIPTTFWRKPFTGMAVLHIEKYKLNPSACLFVGDMTVDETFAKRAGFQFSWAEEFFA